ncbi:MAG TPA: response regulator [Methanoregula sp.]|nr:response regulator [Methanoregula sp.]
MPCKGKVLVMDDEQIILDVTHEVLKFLDYDVTSATDGLAAIDLYKKEKSAGAPFDIVILDLSVSQGMGGKETIEQLRKFDTGVKAVVSSGYTDDPVVQDFLHYGFCERLTKPYKIDDLKNLLEKLMKK